MDIQTAFNTIVRKLHAQGSAAYKDERCQYRTPDGRACAVGVLMTDDDIATLGTQECEIDVNALTASVTALFRKCLLPPAIQMLPLAFLWSMQAAHDCPAIEGYVGAAWWERFLDRSRNVAEQHDLDASVLDECAVLG